MRPWTLHSIRQELEIALLKKQAEIIKDFDKLEDSTQMTEVDSRAKGISEAIEVVRRVLSE